MLDGVRPGVVGVGVLVEVDVVPGVVVVGVVDVPVVVAGVEEQDSETLATGTVTGSGIEESGVPGGTLTVKESVWPVVVLTVTTQESARAETGIAATAANAAATARSLIHSCSRGLICSVSSRRSLSRKTADAGRTVLPVPM